MRFRSDGKCNHGIQSQMRLPLKSKTLRLLGELLEEQVRLLDTVAS